MFAHSVIHFRPGEIRRTIPLLLMAVLLASSGCNRKEEAAPREVVRPVKLMTVGGAQSGQTAARELPGRVRAAQRVDLAFQVAGPLTELPVEEGQQMAKGQVIARILPRDFETAVKKAAARALEAEQQFRRYKDLYIRKQVSKADFDRYKSQYDVAKAQEKELRDRLADTVLKAPFAGVVAKRYVENFQEVKAKEPIISLQDISDLEVLVDVPENLMARVRRGRKGPVAEAEFASAPGRRFPLTVKEFATEADSRTQTFLVTLEMKAPKGVQILPGMTAVVRSIGDPVKDAKAQRESIVVPAVAVFSDPAGVPHVWVVDRESMTVAGRKVMTGDLRGTDSIEITDGVRIGETIAVSGVTVLREGMKVRDLAELEGFGK